MGNLKYSYRNLSHCNFVHHTFYTDWPGIEPRPLWWVVIDK